MTTSAFTGCRCCYDPNSDGGEYRALIELRASTNHPTNQQQVQGDDEEKKFERDEGSSKGGINVSDNGDEDSDDEFDYLLDEDLPGQDDAIKAMEESRRAELELSMLSREVALQHGYGTHRQLHPVRVLKAIGLSSSSSSDRGGGRDPPHAAVLHLFDPDSMASASLDLYLEQTLSIQYPGTVFVRSGGRSTLLMDPDVASNAFSSLARQQFTLEPDRDMPALVAIRDGIVVNVCPKLHGLVDSSGSHRDDDARIVDHAVRDWLDRCGVLVSQAPPLEELCHIRPEEDALMDYLSQQVQQQKDDDELHRYDCGLAECNKTYPHEHIGIKTSEQDGLVVKESDVVGSTEEVGGDTTSTAPN